MSGETTGPMTPEQVALKLHARLVQALDNGQALRDVVNSIANNPGNETTIRAALKLLVRAYDENDERARAVAEAG